MRLTRSPDTPSGSAIAPVRRPAVAGSFYPDDPAELAGLVDRLLAAARPSPERVAEVRSGLAGILVPHAGLAYSGAVAATAWALAEAVATSETTAVETPHRSTIVLLGTNHGAGWLDGVGVWDAGAWRTPLGDVEAAEDLAGQILELGPPFVVDRDAHRSEHSLEVQLPFIRAALPGARIVPLSVSTGTGDVAIRAGERLGALLAAQHGSGTRTLLAISTDMAHYPAAATATRVTEVLLPGILSLDPAAVARREAEVCRSGPRDVACGMCGIQPTVLGLAALRAMGVQHGVELAAATSADAGGPSERTVGYLAVAFPG